MITAIHQTNSLSKFGAVSLTLRIGFGKTARYITIALIVRIEGSGNYSWLHTSNGQRYIVSKTLSTLQRDLPTFWRVHKSHLINPAYVLSSAGMVRNQAILRLLTNETIVVARRHKKDVCKRLKSLNR